MVTWACIVTGAVIGVVWGILWAYFEGTDDMIEFLIAPLWLALICGTFGGFIGIVLYYLTN